MLDELEWPSLEARREQSSLTFFYKIHSGTMSLEKDKYLTPAPNLSRTKASHDSQYTSYLGFSDALKNSFFPGTIPGIVSPLRWSHVFPLSPIGRIQILTYLIWGFLGAAILDCIIRSCDLFYWFIRTCLCPTVVPAAITSLELFCVLTMWYFPDNVSSKENIKISWLIFMFYYGDIIAIKNSYWFFSFT